jgi:hypothetical protein
MIILTETTDKIQVSLSEAVISSQLQCIASYRDASISDFVPGRTATATNNTTDVDIVPSPTAGYARSVDYISIYNKDIKAADVTVKLNLNSVQYTLWKGIISTGEKLEYINGLGFLVKDSIGTETTQSLPEFDTNLEPTLYGPGLVVLNEDYSYPPYVSFQDVPGLQFPVKANVLYFFQFTIRYETDSVNTGTAFSIKTTPFAYLMYDSNYSLAAGSVTTNENLVAADGGVINASTTYSPNARAVIRGACVPSTDGFIIARVASETSTANSIITKAGSFVEYRSAYQY